MVIIKFARHCECRKMSANRVQNFDSSAKIALNVTESLRNVAVSCRTEKPFGNIFVILFNVVINLEVKCAVTSRLMINVTHYIVIRCEFPHFKTCTYRSLSTRT